LVLLLAFSTLIGCGAKQETNSSTTPANSPAKGNAEAKKPDKKFEMILTSEVPNTHFRSGLMKHFAEEITKRTNCRIDALPSLGTGVVHSVWPVSVQLESFNPAYGVLTLPFAVTDEIMLNPGYRNKFLNMLSPLS
jgi:TRAP-type C4-dicarboxylate transport system substrate-binding protein